MSMTPTQVVNLLTQKWRPGFELLPNEEMVIADGFFDASGGVTKGINNQLNLRKIDIATVQSLAAGGTGLSLTYNTFTDYVVPLTPTFDYSGVEIPLHTLARIDDEAALQSAYKKQLVAGLATTMDVAGATAVASLTTNTSGSSAYPALDQSLFLDGWNKLIVSAKDQFRVGVTKATLVVYNKQAKNIINIPGFTYSYIRGDGEGPLVRGWVNEAMNTTIKESGNVYASSGTAHNVLYLPMAFAKAYNLKPTILDPQPVETVIRIIAVQDRGVKIYFDQYAADLMTSSS